MADTLFHKALKYLSGVKSVTHLQRLFRQQSKAKSSKAFRGAKVDITQPYQIMKTISRYCCYEFLCFIQCRHLPKAFTVHAICSANEV